MAGKGAIKRVKLKLLGEACFEKTEKEVEKKKNTLMKKLGQLTRQVGHTETLHWQAGIL